MDLASIIQNAVSGMPKLLGSLAVDVDIDIPTVSYDTATSDNVYQSNVVSVKAAPVESQTFEGSSGTEVELKAYLIFPEVVGDTIHKILTPLLLSIPTLSTLTHSMTTYKIAAVDSFVAGENVVGFRVGVSR